MLVVVFGVMGSGKSTVGAALAAPLDWAFADGDDHHPSANLRKLEAGEPLTDADRGPWLDVLAAELRDASIYGRDLVLACSALKRAYRDRLRVVPGVRFVFLHGSREALTAQLGGREGHFADPELLDSQLATLEVPTEDEADVLFVDIGLPLDAKVERLRGVLGV